MKDILIGVLIGVACYIVIPRQPQSLILTLVVTAIWFFTTK
jgi:hypothetical protein